MADLLNRARMTIASTGTGDVTFGSAVTNYQSFADAGAVDTGVYHYVIEDGSAWEIGTLVYTASGTTGARTVTESTNSDAALNLTSGAEIYSAVTKATIDDISGDLLSTNNLSDVANASTARTNLELATVGQAEAEAGTATTTRAWTAQRVKQAIDALATGSTDPDDLNNVVVDADNNTGLGKNALASLTSGTDNAAFGKDALISLTTGYNVTAIGPNCGEGVTTGNLSVYVGQGAGSTTSITGSQQVCIGYNANPSSAAASAEITLGNSGVSTLRCQQTSITALSDARFKENIVGVRPEFGLDLIERVRVVEFDWNERDEGLAGKHQVGVIAQEMAQIEDDLDADFLKLTLRENPERLEAAPGQLLLPLIKAVQELSAKNSLLENRLAALEAAQ